MARKKKSYRHYTAKIPVALTVGFASSALGGVLYGSTVLDHLMRGDYVSAWNRLQLNFTGSYPGQPFDLTKMNLMPLLIGASVSTIASKFGVNRRLAALGLPIKL